MMPTRRNPGWVDVILDWRWTSLLARVALTGAYVLGGLTKLADFNAAIAEQEHFGMHPGWLWATLTIAVELVGSALVISGRLVWLGAGMLGVFTGLAACLANDFWTMRGAERFAATNAFFEHIGLIGGFAMAALIARRKGRGRAAEGDAG
jgi:uncharacterized membrane protein YphA (DoxX/SURF4 family)